MTEPKPLRRPRPPVSADSSAVLAYLSELEAYTSTIERAGRQLVADVRQAESAWADHAGAHLQTIARLEAELAFKRGVLDQVLQEVTAARIVIEAVRAQWNDEPVLNALIAAYDEAMNGGNL